MRCTWASCNDCSTKNMATQCLWGARPSAEFGLKSWLYPHLGPEHSASVINKSDCVTLKQSAKDFGRRKVVKSCLIPASWYSSLGPPSPRASSGLPAHRPERAQWGCCCELRERARDIAGRLLLSTFSTDFKRYVCNTLLSYLHHIYLTFPDVQLESNAANFGLLSDLSALDRLQWPWNCAMRESCFGR